MRKLVVLALLVGGFNTCGPKVPEYRPNVVLITIDTQRTDHMSLYGYERDTTPRIDEWFGNGAVFERAYATTSYTPSSVISFLTGMYPQNHGVRYFIQPLDEGVPTLATRLSKVGYETAAFVSNVNLRSEWIGLGTHFDYYDDVMTERERFRGLVERSAAASTDDALKWLSTRHDEERPFFLWVHYIDPHGPYTPPDPKVREFGHDGPQPVELERIPEYQRHPDLDDGLEYVDLYDEEIAHMDHHVGRLFDGLAAFSDPADTIYALTADHGECLMDHDPWFSHGHDIYEDTIHVPLALRGPGIVPRRDDTPVSIVDIVPTVLDAIGLKIPKRIDGVSLAETTPERLLHIESQIDMATGRWKGIVDGSRKWAIYQPKHEADLEFRVYDLEADPAELDNESWTPAGVKGTPAVLLRHWQNDPADFMSAGGWLMEIDKRLNEAKELEEELKALGYL